MVLVKLSVFFATVFVLPLFDNSGANAVDKRLIPVPKTAQTASSSPPKISRQFDLPLHKDYKKKFDVWLDFVENNPDELGREVDAAPPPSSPEPKEEFHLDPKRCYDRTELVDRVEKRQKVRCERKEVEQCHQSYVTHFEPHVEEVNAKQIALFPHFTKQKMQKSRYARTTSSRCATSAS